MFRRCQRSNFGPCLAEKAHTKPMNLLKRINYTHCCSTKNNAESKVQTRCVTAWRTHTLRDTVSRSCEDDCSSVPDSGKLRHKESGGAIEPLNELHWASGCVTLDTLIKMLSNRPKSWKRIRECNKHVAETINEGRRHMESTLWNGLSNGETLQEWRCFPDRKLHRATPLHSLRLLIRRSEQKRNS